MKKRAFITILSLLLIVVCAATLFLFAGCSSSSGSGDGTSSGSKASTSDADGVITMSSSRSGGTIYVTARLEKNCGINMMDLILDYDTSVLTLTDAKKGSALRSLDPLYTGDYKKTPFKFTYLNADSNDTSTGELFTLTFKMKNAGKKETTVGLKYNNIKSLTADGLTERSFAITPVTIALS